MHSRNATHLSAISDFSDPHFTSAINESHDQLNPNPSPQRTNKRESKSQKILLGKHIELEGTHSLQESVKTSMRRRRRQTERHLEENYRGRIDFPRHSLHPMFESSSDQDPTFRDKQRTSNFYEKN